MTNREIEERADRATPSPWYWRAEKHTSDRNTSDAGGLHTKSSVEALTPDGRRLLNENVVFPAAKVAGIHVGFRSSCTLLRGKPTLSLAPECFGKDEDKEFIACAREDITALVSEIHRLQIRFADLGIQEP